MGQADIATKEFMQNPKVIAEVFNYYLYQGEPLIQPEKLQSVDPLLFTALDSQKSSRKERDVLTYWVGMQEENLTYLILGIENQTYVDYTMPARTLIYNAAQLEKQLKERRRSLKKMGYKNCTEEEMLCGFRKTDKLKAVITIVIYFGQKPWDGPTHLLDMYEELDERTRKLIPDYPLYLITPDSLTDEDLELFSSGFEQLMLILRDCRNKETLEDHCSSDPRLQSIDVEVIKVINAVTDLNIEIPEEGGKVNMLEAFIEWKEEWIEKWLAEGREKGLAEGHAEGHAEGRAKGREEGYDENAIASIQALMETQGMTVQESMEALKIPMGKRNYYKSKLSN